MECFKGVKTDDVKETLEFIGKFNNMMAMTYLDHRFAGDNGTLNLETALKAEMSARGSE